MQESSQHPAQAAKVLELIHFCTAAEKTIEQQHYLHFLHSPSVALDRLSPVLDEWRVGRRIDSCAANSRGPLDQWDTLQVISGNEKSIGVIDTRRPKSNFRLIKHARLDRRPLVGRLGP